MFEKKHPFLSHSNIPRRGRSLGTTRFESLDDMADDEILLGCATLIARGGWATLLDTCVPSWSDNPGQYQPR
jgi:hypothetical protein